MVTAADRTRARDKARKMYPPPLGTCEEIGCDAEAVDRHHEDYTKPEQIVRLCRDCHLRRHGQLTPKARLVAIIVPNITEAIRNALVDDARARDVSVNEAAVGPLARSYGVPRDPGGGRFIEVGDVDVMTIRIPAPLRRKLRARAAREDVTIGGLVRACWAEAFGLPVESAKRRPRS